MAGILDLEIEPLKRGFGIVCMHTQQVPNATREIEALNADFRSIADDPWISILDIRTIHDPPDTKLIFFLALQTLNVCLPLLVERPLVL
jgi:hypothetical protein